MKRGGEDYEVAGPLRVAKWFLTPSFLDWSDLISAVSC